MKVSRTTLVGLALAVFATTIWLFWPSIHGEFLEGDDLESYLRPAMRLHGLTWNAVKWAFTCTFSYYQPLARLSHVVDYQLWGTTAAGHHATSVVVHALNAALVLGFLWKLLGATSLTDGERLAVAVGVAVVFALHPLQVETVSWVSCRTELLCGTFGILSVWAYAADARWWTVWGLFAAAMLSTPLAVSLPFVMLAMDYFPLRRYEQTGWRRLLWEKTAMIAFAAAVGLATMITKSRIDQMIPLTTVSLSKRVYLMFGSLAFYLWNLFWPSHLSPVYPIASSMSLDQGPVLASVLTVLVITVVAVREHRRVPMLTAAWGAYAVVVLPVSGIMPTGGSVLAHRYTYVAMLPLLTLASGAGIWLWRRSTPVARVVLIGLLAGQLCAFGVYSRQLIGDWRNDETRQRAILQQFPDAEVVNREFAMWLLGRGRTAEALTYAQRAVGAAPQGWEAHMALGSVLSRLGRLQEAMAQNEQALRLNPNPALGHYNFGLSLMDLDNVPEAAKHFEQALQSKPDFAQAHLNLGMALLKLGRPEDAIRHYEEAVRVGSNYPEAHLNLGGALMMQGRVPEAITHFNETLRIEPDYAEAYYNRAVALEQVGRLPEAVADYEEALRLKLDYAQTHLHLGQALEKLGRLDEAVEQYEQALQTNPGNVEAHVSLGSICLRMGDIRTAIGEYEEALRIDPNQPEAHSNLGAILQRMGRLREAVTQYELALQSKPDYVEAHFNLGLALEKLGRTPEAIEHYQQAFELRPDFAAANKALTRLQASQ